MGLKLIKPEVKIESLASAAINTGTVKITYVHTRQNHLLQGGILQGKTNERIYIYISIHTSTFNSPFLNYKFVRACLRFNGALFNVHRRAFGTDELCLDLRLF